MAKSFKFSFQTDPADAVTYEEAVALLAAWLNTFPHGALKKFAEEDSPGLNYAGLINLKNNKLLRPAPLAVQRLLETLGFKVDVQRTRDPETRKTGHQYTFTKKGERSAFKDAYQKYVTTKPKPADPAESGADQTTG